MIKHECLCQLEVSGPSLDEWQPTYIMWEPFDSEGYCDPCECPDCWVARSAKDEDYCSGDCNPTCCKFGIRSKELEQPYWEVG